MQCCTSLVELLDFTVQVAAVVTIFYFQPLLGLMSPPFCHIVLCQAGLEFVVARGVQEYSTLHTCFSVWAFKTGGTDQTHAFSRFLPAFKVLLLLHLRATMCGERVFKTKFPILLLFICPSILVCLGFCFGLSPDKELRILLASWEKDLSISSCSCGMCVPSAVGVGGKGCPGKIPAEEEDFL